MISILLPSRKRPAALARMVKSLNEVSRQMPEVIVYCDDDDPETVIASQELGIKCITGPRLTFTEYWNKCFLEASGDILMMGADDIVFRTPGWDVMVEECFAEYPDRIVMVSGDDLESRLAPGYGRFSTHPLVHRRWIEALGYFSAPYFSWGSSDTWINDIAKFIDRRRFLPFVNEHMHYRENKSDIDQTYQEGIERLQRDNIAQKYGEMCFERIADAEKLMAKMKEAA